MYEMRRTFRSLALALMLAWGVWGCSQSPTVAGQTQFQSGAALGPAGSVGKIYVSESGPAKVLTFLQTDDGNVSPQFSIDGSGAGVPIFGGIAVGQIGPHFGDLYVTDLANSRVIAYAPTQTGPAQPLLTISCGGMTGPNPLVFDRSGHLYVANSASAPFSISIIPADASGCVTGNPTILGTHTGLYNPQGIASTGAGRLYVANNNQSITEYAPGANGDAGWTHKIHGPHTGIAFNSECGNALTIDAAGNIYAANANGDSITVYAPNANGDATPTRTISGSLTGLDEPRGVAVDKTGDIFVVNSRTGTITAYAPGANGNVAPIRTIAGSKTQLIGLAAGIALSR